MRSTSLLLAIVGVLLACSVHQVSADCYSTCTSSRCLPKEQACLAKCSTPSCDAQCSNTMTQCSNKCMSACGPCESSCFYAYNNAVSACTYACGADNVCFHACNDKNFGIYNNCKDNCVPNNPPPPAAAVVEHSSSSATPATHHHLKKKMKPSATHKSVKKASPMMTETMLVSDDPPDLQCEDRCQVPHCDDQESVCVGKCAQGDASCFRACAQTRIDCKFACRAACAPCLATCQLQHDYWNCDYQCLRMAHPDQCYQQCYTNQRNTWIACQEGCTA